jgi:hypothetical protein
MHVNINADLRAVLSRLGAAHREKYYELGQNVGIDYGCGTGYHRASLPVPERHSACGVLGKRSGTNSIGNLIGT